MKINRKCPFCGQTTTLSVSDEAYFAWESGTHAQVAFPELTPTQRDVIINGMCYECSEKLYNRPAPGHEEAFGTFLGNCSCCDRAVYEKDVVNGKFTCDSCGGDEYE